MAWNRTVGVDHASLSARKRGGQGLKIIIYVLILFVLAAGIILWVLKTRDVRVHEDRTNSFSGHIAEVKPSIASQTKPSLEKVLEAKDPHAGMVQAPNGVWHPKGIPFLTSWKKPHVVVTNNVGKQATAATCTTEQILLQIFSRNRGDMPLPLPAVIPESDYSRMAELLINRAVVDEVKDSDEIKRQKAVLNEVKEEMLKVIKEGGSVEDFILDYHEELRRCYFKKYDAQLMVNKMEREGEDPQVICAVVNKLNETLAAEGIEPGIVDPTNATGVEEE